MNPTYFHIAAFGGAKTDSVANENVPAAIDNALTTSANSRYLAPARVEVFAAMVNNDTVTRARLSAPSMRNEGLPEIYPLNVSNTTPVNMGVAEWEGVCPVFQELDEFGIECTNGVSTVKRAHAFLAFREQKAPVPSGKRMSIFGTSTQTLLLDGWTLGGITLDQVLPPGVYSVIGMHCKCPSAIAARLVFPRSQSYRPGCPTVEAVGSFEHRQLFRNGRLGEWGRFQSIAQPQLEIFGIVAGAQTAQVVIDLVQVSANVP